jgi:hypothetical protein
VPLLAIVIAGNVGLILTGAKVLLVSVYVYTSSIVPMGYTGILAFVAIVSSRVRRYKRYTLLSLVLLASLELSVVDRNSSIYICV